MPRPKRDHPGSTLVVSPNTAAAAVLLRCSRARIERAADRQYIIYQQNAQIVNSGSLTRGVGATDSGPEFGPGRDELRGARLEDGGQGLGDRSDEPELPARRAARGR
jgi:hypothetical protein